MRWSRKRNRFRTEWPQRHRGTENRNSISDLKFETEFSVPLCLCGLILSPVRESQVIVMIGFARWVVVAALIAGGVAGAEPKTETEKATETAATRPALDIDYSQAM